MRKILFVMLLMIALISMGCGGSGDDGQDAPEDNGGGIEEENEQDEGESSADEPDETEEASDPGEFETAVGETTVNESGSFTLVARASDIPTQEDGPIILNIPQVNAIYGELEEDFAEMMEMDVMHYIQIDMEVENTSEETVTFYASQAIITTNTGEQLEADFWLSDHIEGTYIGEVKKSGTQFFILEESKAEEIEWVRIIISRPTNEDWDSLGEGIDFRVEFDQ